MRLFLLIVGSWILGVVMFWLVGSFAAGRVMGSGDISAAAVYSLVIFGPTAPLIYLPAIWWARLRARYATAIMSVATVVHTVTATALLLRQFGGFRLSMLTTSEALSFYVLFGTAGLVMTLGTLNHVFDDPPAHG